LFEHEVPKARQTAISIRKNLEVMGPPDRTDHDRLAEYMMLYLTARIYENVNTNHFGGRERYGHVGAVIIIPGFDEIIFYQSKKMGNGWYHAERGAWRVAKRFCKKRGLADLPDGCILIVSMEPCVGEVTGRIGCSCSELVQSKNFSKVYVGYRDWTLADGNTGERPQWPANWKLITDGYVRQVGKELYDFFGDWYISRMAP